LPINPDTFKEVMSRWASGVTIVTARTDDGRVHGMTANSFTSVSLDPPLVLICVDHKHLTNALILGRKSFAINVLHSEAAELSNRCAGFRGIEGHWLDDIETRTETTGAPILVDALAWVDCTLWEAYQGGDHTIFVGEIQAGGTSGGEPLLWFSRGYRRLAE
jgi:flavin reductase (DIM6/NTAB) family NADH-FMN oxidoreductase RutF